MQGESMLVYCLPPVSLGRMWSDAAYSVEYYYIRRHRIYGGVSVSIEV